MNTKNDIGIKQFFIAWLETERKWINSEDFLDVTTIFKNANYTFTQDVLVNLNTDVLTTSTNTEMKNLFRQAGTGEAINRISALLNDLKNISRSTLKVLNAWAELQTRYWENLYDSENEYLAAEAHGRAYIYINLQSLCTELIRTNNP